MKKIEKKVYTVEEVDELKKNGLIIKHFHSPCK